MNYGISRAEALALVKEHIGNRNLVNHSLASEAVLRALAEDWGGRGEVGADRSSS